MRRLLSICILTLGALCCSARAAISIDELSKTVVFLRQQSQKTYQQGDKKFPLWYSDPNTKTFERVIETFSGTGVLIKYNKRDYIVTAKHVAKKLTPSAEIVVNLPGAKSRITAFEVLSKQQVVQGARWFHHPQADISVHPMAYAGKVEQVAVAESLYPEKNSEAPLLTPAYVIGFPLGMGVHDILSPLAKGTQIASKPTSIDFPGISPDLQFILLDQALAQGYSGSPVFYTEDIMSKARIGTEFLKAGEKLHFVGIVSGTISDSTGGKITLVVPISYVWDILKSADFGAYESSLPPM